MVNMEAGTYFVLGSNLVKPMVDYHPNMTQIECDTDWFLSMWIAHEQRIGRTYPLPSSFENSLLLWLTRYGIPFVIYAEGLDLAFTSSAVIDESTEAVWLYFCKVVWNRIRDAARSGWSI